ncbi:hypothetical protein ALC57_10134 [Trachymyrmex cornetzi]|uniref:CCHC-type domain-containing protein n=1 Tax=Trachymyrmex cornetzi TaxID=471704 RepID=A0A151J4L3_9HYME|nr:hypothetical protein ALC57_10134 [Trachymyrmex cornetzi]
MSTAGEPPAKVALNSPRTRDGADNNLNITYDEGDISPFIIFVKRAMDGNGGDSRLDPVSVARVMTRIANDKITEVKSSGRNKVAVHFNDRATANKVLSHPLLKESGLSASIPAFRILRTGVIKNVSFDISENDILNHFTSPYKIVSAKRLNVRIFKDGESTFAPSRTILVKFRGQCLPRSVTYLHVSFPVMPYFPRVLMCFSCLRYGHVSSDCKSKPRCARCGSQKHPTAEDCPRHQLPPCVLMCFSCLRYGHVSFDCKSKPRCALRFPETPYSRGLPSSPITSYLLQLRGATLALFPGMSYVHASQTDLCLRHN